jgi:TPR repeat protein
MYDEGRGVLSEDDERAVTLYRQGCEAGDAEGCARLGWMYSHGHGVPKSETGAVTFYERACDRGDALGCGNLGVMYEYGRGGLAQDSARATSLYQQGCDGGDPTACANLKQSRRVR